MIESIIDTRGRTTLPREVRERIGFEPGAKLVWIVTDIGSATLTPKARSAPHSKFKKQTAKRLP